jgi:hypothetical protein
MNLLEARQGAHELQPLRPQHNAQQKLPQRHRPTRPAPPLGRPLGCAPAKNLKSMQARQTPEETPLFHTNDQQSTTPGNSNPSHLRCLYDNGTCAWRLFHTTVIGSSQSRRPTLGTSPAFAITAPVLPSSSVSISNCQSETRAHNHRMQHLGFHTSKGFTAYFLQHVRDKLLLLHISFRKPHIYPKNTSLHRTMYKVYRS